MTAKLSSFQAFLKLLKQIRIEKMHSFKYLHEDIDNNDDDHDATDDIVDFYC